MEEPVGLGKYLFITVSRVTSKGVRKKMYVYIIV